jgi:hypothetical protein
MIDRCLECFKTWWIKISEEVEDEDKILLKVWVLAHL